MKTIDKKSKGKWIKFKQGVFNTNLVHMLEDGGIDLGPYPNKEVQNIIKDGDLYCYHITDTSLTPTPHIMIKTKGRYLIEEIYGSTFKSTVSKELLPILKRKLRIESKFLNKHHYLKMISNEMKLNKLMNKKNYTKADLKFLYEIEEQIEILGDSKEVKTKIKKCLDGRNMRQDLITIFGCSNEELAIGQNEFTSNTKYLYGDLDLHEVFNGVNIILPKVIIGSLNLTGLTATENIQMPDFVRGNLDMRNISQAQELVLPYYVGKNLHLDSLKDVNNLQLPYLVGGSVHLESLEKYHRLNLPEFVNGSLYLNSFKSSESIRLPKYIGKNISLCSLQDLQGLKLPKKVAGTLDLSSVRTLKNFKLPDIVVNDLILSNVTELEGVCFPEHIDGTLDLSNVQTIEGVILPDYVGKDLILDKLKKINGVIFPMYIGNDLFLDNLEEAQNLTLPKIVRRHTYLKKLKKYKDLTLPEESDYIYLGQLEVAKNPLYVKNIKIFDAFNLMDISGLKLSREMTEDRFFVPGVTLDELTYNGEAYYTNEKQLIKHR